MTEKMPSNKGSNWKSAGALGMPDIYKHYVSECEGALTRKVFSKVLNSCNKEFMSLIIGKGKSMRMPKLGILEIVKNVTNNSSIDFKEFLDTGKIVKHTNEHSDGYVGWFRWDKFHLPIPGKAAYCFEPARDNARNLTTELKEFGGHLKYKELKRKTYGK